MFLLSWWHRLSNCWNNRSLDKPVLPSFPEWVDSSAKHIDQMCQGLMLDSACHGRELEIWQTTDTDGTKPHENQCLLTNHGHGQGTAWPHVCFLFLLFSLSLSPLSLSLSTLFSLSFLCVCACVYVYASVGFGQALLWCTNLTPLVLSALSGTRWSLLSLFADLSGAHHTWNQIPFLIDFLLRKMQSGSKLLLCASTLINVRLTHWHQNCVANHPELQ